jgi:hypothetical protein
MKAYLVSEKMNNFERGQDPKEAMNLGLKNKFIQLFPKSLGGGFSNSWKKIKEIIQEPTTQISFEPDLTTLYLYHGTNKTRIRLILPEHKMNYFFFEGIQTIIDAHSPKIIQGLKYDDKEMLFYYYD